jgi:hypothetical protein
MDALLLNVGQLLAGFLCILGPLGFLLAHLRLRDQREATLSLAALRELNTPELRGMLAVKVESRFIGRDKVVVDVGGCSREQLWGVMEKLTVKLPSHVRVQVNGLGDNRFRPAWILTANRKLPSAAVCP